MRVLLCACVLSLAAAKPDDRVSFNSILVTAAPTSFAPTNQPVSSINFRI